MRSPSDSVYVESYRWTPRHRARSNLRPKISRRLAGAIVGTGDGSLLSGPVSMSSASVEPRLSLHLSMGAA